MTYLIDLKFHPEGPAMTDRTLAGAMTSPQICAEAWEVTFPSMPTDPPAASRSPANPEGPPPHPSFHLKDSASRYFLSCAGDLARPQKLKTNATTILHTLPKV